MPALVALKLYQRVGRLPAPDADPERDDKMLKIYKTFDHKSIVEISPVLSNANL